MRPNVRHCHRLAQDVRAFEVMPLCLDVSAVSRSARS
jgi:hypothetical protein